MVNRTIRQENGLGVIVRSNMNYYVFIEAESREGEKIAKSEKIICEVEGK